MPDGPKMFPIQTHRHNRNATVVCEAVYMSAYEVYCHVYSPQEAIITGNCRGGFSIGELTAFLYAKAFPRDEWRKRVDEAFVWMNL